MAKSNSKKSNQDAYMKRIAELEKENKQLQEKLKKPSNNKSKTRVPRRFVSYVCLTLAAILSVSAVNALWVSRFLTDTDTWIETTSEIIQDPVIRENVSEIITETIYDEINLESEVEGILPETASILAVPLSGAVRDFTEEKVNTVLASPEFIELWELLNESAHSSLIKALETADSINDNNEELVLYLDNDSLILNLRPLINDIKQDLRNAGITILPEDQVVSSDKTTYRLVEIENLSSILTGYRYLKTMNFWLPMITLTLAIAGIALATNRRAAIYYFFILTLAIGIVNLQLLKLPGYDFGSNVGDSGLSAETSKIVYLTITNAVVVSLRVLVGFSAFMILATYMTSSSKFPVRFRGYFSNIFSDPANNTLLMWVNRFSQILITTIVVLTIILVLVVDFGGAWIPVTLVFGSALLVAGIQALKKLDK